ncbi:hypothetical protein HWI79_1284 [Cryptosporidium felis]|nr:hypothetical protein HWI79_1284 [Cryptosporidium felis]
MGCCVTKDVNAFEKKKVKKEGITLSFSRGLHKFGGSYGNLDPYLDLVEKYSKKKLREQSPSQWELLQSQVEEMHAIWIISMLRQLRSEVDTIYLLSRLIEIMELLDPLDGNLMIRKHMCESGAAEILSNTVGNHLGSPDIVLVCIFLLIHIMFNDGVSESIVPKILPQILDLLLRLKQMDLAVSANISILTAIFKLIFVSSSDSTKVSKGWGFGALRFLVGTNLDICKEFLDMGILDLATTKLEKSRDAFLIENILGLYAAILTTSKDFKLNNPVIIREVMRVTYPNLRNERIVQLCLIILILSCQRTQVYSHVITAYGAKKLINLITITYKKRSLYSHIHTLCELLLVCLCSCCSKTTSIQLINDRLVFSQQCDPAEDVVLKSKNPVVLSTLRTKRFQNREGEVHRPSTEFSRSEGLGEISVNQVLPEKKCLQF